MVSGDYIEHLYAIYLIIALIGVYESLSKQHTEEITVTSLKSILSFVIISYNISEGYVCKLFTLMYYTLTPSLFDTILSYPKRVFTNIDIGLVILKLSDN